MLGPETCIPLPWIAVLAVDRRTAGRRRRGELERSGPSPAAMTAGGVILFAVEAARRRQSRRLEASCYETPAARQEEEQICASEQAVKSNRIAQASEIGRRSAG